MINTIGGVLETNPLTVGPIVAKNLLKQSAVTDGDDVVLLPTGTSRAFLNNFSF